MTTGRINQVTARTRGPATRTRAPPKEGSARARAGLVAASDLLDLSIFLRTGSGGRSPFRPTPFFVISSRPVRAYGTSPFIIVITLCVCVCDSRVFRYGLRHLVPFFFVGRCAGRNTVSVHCGTVCLRPVRGEPNTIDRLGRAGTGPLRPRSRFRSTSPYLGRQRGGSAL